MCLCVCVCALSVAVWHVKQLRLLCLLPRKWQKGRRNKRSAAHARSFTSASQRRWLQSRVEQSRAERLPVACHCWPTIASFWGKWKAILMQQLCVPDARFCAAAAASAAVVSLLPQSFVLHMTKMLAASVKDCTEHGSSLVQVWQALHTIELPTRPVQSAVI